MTKRQTSGRAGAALLLVSALLTGCAGTDQLGGLGLTPSGGSREGEAGAGRATRSSAADPQAALEYAQRLKAAGRKKEALAVLDAVPEAGRTHQPLLVEHGLLALELGQTAKGQQLLLRASGKTKDWQVHSGLGVAAANLGQQADAQKHFSRALELSPNNPTVLNNLALSYVLERRLSQAEELLQRAARSNTPPPRVARNLELARTLKKEAGVADVAQWTTTTTTTTRERTASIKPTPAAKPPATPEPVKSDRLALEQP